ncbi:response regulator transcription factor [Chloroflexota bacterium]
MSSRKPRVLVVDDNIRILRMIRRILELESCHVTCAGNAEEALRTLDEETPDLILLDIMMPGMDGHTLCQHIREYSQVPIIMVTAKSSDEEKVAGLDAGADDYLTKPFSSGELAARVRAVLRRGKLSGDNLPSFQLNGLVVDFTSNRVVLNGKDVDLTAIEYRILSYLVGNAGRVVTPENILDHVWGEAYSGENHLLQVNINRLRKKIGDNTKKPKYIFTKSGIGYLVPK